MAGSVGGTPQNTVEAAAYEELFQTDAILNLRVEIADSDWQDILADPKAEAYKSVSVTVDGSLPDGTELAGVSLDNVGLRTKGNSSLNTIADSDSERYSFRIKFDKYVKGQRLLGLDELVANCQYADASYMREYLSYEALRAIGSPAPLAAYANLYINGELYGFYLCVEAEDNAFLERNFGDDNGNLYKQEMGSSLVYEQDSDYPKSELKKGSDTQKTGLKRFIQTLNEMPEGEKGEIESVLNVDTALAYIAANTVLGNYDSYSGSMLQNYYLYERDGKFSVIPWDYNMSMGGFMGTSSSGTSIPIDEPVYGVSKEQTPLIFKLLAVEEYKQRYYEYIRQLLAYLDGFESRVEGLAAYIRYVEADPTKFVTMAQFEAAVTYQETQQQDELSAPPDGQKMEGEQMGEPPARPNGQPFGEPPAFPNGQQGETQSGEPPARPDGQPFGEPPAFPNGQQQGENQLGELPARPDGRPNRPADGGGGRGGMGNSHMLAGNGGSIINFVRARTENIRKQLNGELATTGNTTMNNAGRGMPGGGEMGNRPGGRFPRGLEQAGQAQPHGGQ